MQFSSQQSMKAVHDAVRIALGKSAI